MKQYSFVLVAIIAMLCVAPISRAQAPNELSATARGRIEQARASIVTVRAENESAQPVAQAFGFFVRNDLVVTDGSVLKAGSRVRVTAATKEATFQVLSLGNYFLPYVLLEKQSDIPPLPLGDSEKIVVNDSVYMAGDNGAISAGTVTRVTTMNRDPAFLISLPINSSNRGAPIFNRNGEVIGIAAETPDGQGAGLVFPSVLLARLTHLGEPGVGAGRGDGSFAGGSATTSTGTSASSSVDTRPVRLRGPMPRYTDAARANGTEGTVTLRVLVGEDGEVKQIRVIRGLPDGLNEQAIEAARQTKFKPAMKDGKAVPFWIAVQMEFHIR